MEVALVASPAAEAAGAAAAEEEDAPEAEAERRHRPRRPRSPPNTGRMYRKWPGAYPALVEVLLQPRPAPVRFQLPASSSSFQDAVVSRSKVQQRLFKGSCVFQTIVVGLTLHSIRVRLAPQKSLTQ